MCFRVGGGNSQQGVPGGELRPWSQIVQLRDRTVPYVPR